MSRFLIDRYAGLKPYVPGEQPTDMKYIKLNTNESPYPPSPKVFERLNDAEISRLNLYPDPEGKALRDKVASSYGVKPENVFLSNGSDEALAFAYMAFLMRRALLCFRISPTAFIRFTVIFSAYRSSRSRCARI